MSRITDEQRRAAAAKLRAMDSERIDSEYGGAPSLSTLTLGYIADAVGLHYAPYEFTSAELRDRLADLIEPPLQCPYYDSSRHYCSVHERNISDRDALLALAKVLGGMGDRYNEHERYELGTTFRAIAARIREALGEAE